MAARCRLSWRCFKLSKAGHSSAEYEDAFAASDTAGRFAIADGASECAFADLWAKALVESYVELHGPWSRWLPAARQRWSSQVQARELPWYAEAKAHEGAYAAVLGIAFTGRDWYASAVGDCCLFHIRRDRLLRSFPVSSAADFSNRPSLLGSHPRRTTEPLTRRFHVRGDLQAGDALILMTDALAQWFLTQVEMDRRPWNELLEIKTESDFLRLVAALRLAKDLRNDDVTFALIQRD